MSVLPRNSILAFLAQSSHRLIEMFSLRKRPKLAHEGERDFEAKGKRNLQNSSF